LEHEPEQDVLSEMDGASSAATTRAESAGRLAFIAKDADESATIAVHQILTGFPKQRMNMRSATSAIHA
jgi:ribosomal protein L14E/L6E/L27E